MTELTAGEGTSRSAAEPIWTRRTGLAAAALIALVAIGDVLFYIHSVGINFPLFFLGIGVAALLMAPAKWAEPATAAFATIMLMGLLPLVEATSFWGLLSALGGLGLLVLYLSGLLPRYEDWLGAVVRFAVLAPARLIADTAVLIGQAGDQGFGSRAVRGLLIWVVPVVCAIVFLWLFVAANPVLADWLQAVRIDRLLSADTVFRAFFWLLLAIFIWPLLMPQLLRWVPVPEMQGPVRPRPESLLFGAAAIRNSLLVFNALFAVQTATDLIYLWGGVRLPDGISYADYAHRAAYPLIVTAVLAGAFVLAAMRRDGPGRNSVLIRGLVYLWIGQNVWLVISAILRLKLYVEIYLLSELRIAAGIWMGLVAIGLILILARILFEKSNRWLVMANLTALAITLYGVAFLDFPATISSYNVRHSWQMGVSDQPIDVVYLGELGAGAIPAIDDLLANEKFAAVDDSAQLRQLRASLAAEEVQPQDWQGWTWRDARLRQYLSAHPYAPHGIDDK